MGPMVWFYWRHMTVFLLALSQLRTHYNIWFVFASTAVVSVTGFAPTCLSKWLVCINLWSNYSKKRCVALSRSSWSYRMLSPTNLRHPGNESRKHCDIFGSGNHIDPSNYWQRPRPRNRTLYRAIPSRDALYYGQSIHTDSVFVQWWVIPYGSRIK